MILCALDVHASLGVSLAVEEHSTMPTKRAASRQPTYRDRVVELRYSSRERSPR